MFTDWNHLLSLLCVPFDHQGKAFLVSDHCLQHAFSLHHSLCSSLLVAYQGLFDYFTSITKDLPSSHRMELGILQCDFISTLFFLLTHKLWERSKYSQSYTILFLFSLFTLARFNCFVFSALALCCILQDFCVLISFHLIHTHYNILPFK